MIEPQEQKHGDFVFRSDNFTPREVFGGKKPQIKLPPMAEQNDSMMELGVLYQDEVISNGSASKSVN